MYASIQASRAVAAILVVLFHLGGTIALEKYFGEILFAKVFSFGHAGVDFFFVLSGFIITYVHWGDFNNPKKLPVFAKKRVIRIYPIYWIVFLAVAVGAYMSPALRDAIPSEPLVLLQSLALIPQDKLVVGGTGAPLLIVAWSLQYELLFYCVMAVFIVSIRLGLLTVLLLATVGALNWKTTAFPVSFIANEWLFLFGMGALVGVAARTRNTTSHPMMLASFGAALFLATAAFEVFFSSKENGQLSWLYGAGSAITILGLIKMEDLGMVNNWKREWLLRLGDASYALYLIHFPLISLLCKVATKIGLHGLIGATVTFISVLLICLYCSVLLHEKVEQPLLKKMSGKRTHSKSILAS